MWRQRRDDPVAWTAFRPGVRRIGAISAVVAAVCWIQPLIDQFAARGNLGTLLSAGSDRDPTGPGTGARIVATVLTRPPHSGFGRSSGSSTRTSISSTRRTPRCR
jgi:hypothetical protein